MLELAICGPGPPQVLGLRGYHYRESLWQFRIISSLLCPYVPILYPALNVLYHHPSPSRLLRVRLLHSPSSSWVSTAFYLYCLHLTVSEPQHKTYRCEIIMRYIKWSLHGYQEFINHSLESLYSKIAHECVRLELNSFGLGRIPAIVSVLVGSWV